MDIGFVWSDMMIKILTYPKFADILF